MNKLTYRLLNAIILLALTFGGYTNVGASAVAVAASGNIYYVSPTGNDANPGTQAQPWKTIYYATRNLPTGSTLYIRGGDYKFLMPWLGSSTQFKNSGTEANPITLTNYPGEQAVIHVTSTQVTMPAFACYWLEQVPNKTYVKTDWIRFIGTDVTPRTLSNGVVSQKGIVIQGIENSLNYGFQPHGCDHWEIAGIDFVDLGGAIFALVMNDFLMVDNSTDYMYVHDNRVYRYYTETGMQFNGSFNRIENNEIVKVTNVINRPYGCQALNLLGHDNVVRGNKMDLSGNSTNCIGILFEWSRADGSLLENNTITGVYNGIQINGGDNNIIRGNTIIGKSSADIGVSITNNNVSLESKPGYPCNDWKGSGSSSEPMLPPNNPAHADYSSYWPWNCVSHGNQVTNNNIVGFRKTTVQFGFEEPSNVLTNNLTVLPTGTPQTVTPTNSPIPTIIVSSTPVNTNTPTNTPVVPSVRPSLVPVSTFTPTPIPWTATPTASPTPMMPSPTATKSPTATPIPFTPTPTPTATATEVPFTPTSSPVPTLPAVTEASSPTVTSHPTATPVIPVSNGGNSVDIRVANGNDDVEESLSRGRMYINSSDLELIYDNSAQVVGLRFTGVNIPKGAVITNSYIQFKTGQTSSRTINLTIYGEASGNAAAFANTARNVSSRARTSNSVTWTPPAWSKRGEMGTAQRTPNLNAIVQEIVNQPNWNPGNSIVMMVMGKYNNKRVAKSFEGNSAGAPLLHVEFSMPVQAAMALASTASLPPTLLLL